MQEIGKLTEILFSDTPKGLLYHYTTLKGLLGIVGSSTLWASDVRYMNDSAELKHTADLIRKEVRKRVFQGDGNADLLSQFSDWVSNRITDGHMMFASSFRAHGNLLSQWRGYSSHGKGVSLGFSADFILRCAKKQQFQIGKCIYEPVQQRKLISQVLDAVEADVQDHIQGDESREQLTCIYKNVFQNIEVDLLRIAAILKHPSFLEEKEWRIVSPVIPRSSDVPILFREANAMLVPYIEFDLFLTAGQSPQLEHLYLGPTSNINISMNSLRMFLQRNAIDPAQGIEYCRIPYRQK